MPRQDRIKTKYPGVYYVMRGQEKSFILFITLTIKRLKKRQAVNLQTT